MTTQQFLFFLSYRKRMHGCEIGSLKGAAIVRPMEFHDRADLALDEHVLVDYDEGIRNEFHGIDRAKERSRMTGIQRVFFVQSNGTT